MVGIVKRRRDQATAAERDRDAEMDGARRAEGVVDPEAVERGQRGDRAAPRSATAPTAADARSPVVVRFSSRSQLSARLMSIWVSR